MPPRETSVPTLTTPTTSDAGVLFIASFEGFHVEIYGDLLGEERTLARVREDVVRAELTVRLAVMVPLSQSQFDALVSFVCDVGSGNFRDSALLRRVNAGDFLGAATEFGKWTRSAGRVLPPAARRRRT